VAAREPNTFASDSAEEGWRRRPDDPHIRERNELIGAVIDHGTVSFRSPRQAHVRRDDASTRDRAAGL